LPDDASQVSKLRSQLASDLSRFEPLAATAVFTDSRVEREQIEQTLEQVLDRATLARAIGDHQLTAEYYTIAQQIYDVNPPQSPIEQAAFWHSFGLVAMDAGDYEGARKRFSQAVDIDARVLGADHPATIAARYNLGLAFEQLGNDTAALEAYQEAFEAAVAALGDHHTQTANIAYRLGLIREKLGDLEGAISLLTLAADAYRRARPDDSLELQVTLQQIARLASAQ
jgi:tetratricopeptide (TPR) repeat protein